MVVVAAGIRPHDELARQAGLTIGAAPGGIVVNDHLQTSDPDIHALGECAHHRGTIYGLVAPGHAMADVLVKRLLGDTQAAFTEGDVSTRLKIAGATVAVMGQFDADDARMQRTLILRNNRLIGATVVGDWDQLPDLQTAVDQEKLVSGRRLKRFQKTGDLGWYRLLHTVLGLLCLVGLVVHTGMHLGHNLNFALMVCFLGLNAVGAIAGIATALEAKSQSAWAHTARRFRPWLTWAHILFFWPLPVLVGFHIAAVYLY